MLEFAKAVKAPDSEATIYVFVDPEKGHTAYLSHTGMLTVLEDAKPKQSKTKAAGFAINSDDCTSCGGC